MGSTRSRRVGFSLPLQSHVSRKQRHGSSSSKQEPERPRQFPVYFVRAKQRSHRSQIKLVHALYAAPQVMQSQEGRARDTQQRHHCCRLSQARGGAAQTSIRELEHEISSRVKHQVSIAD